MENIICNRNENIDLLIPYINKPVYIEGFCWNKAFNGWVIIYDRGKDNWRDMNLVFDYRGKTYSVYGFLPSRFDLQVPSSSNRNAIYKSETSYMKERYKW